MTLYPGYELARTMREKILIDHAVDVRSAMDLGIALDKIISIVRKLEEKVICLKRAAEPTEEFLLNREFDIANSEADLGMLKDLFRSTFEREPRDAHRCPKCNTILANLHYVIEEFYSFEGLRGRCLKCKKSVDVEDPE